MRPFNPVAYLAAQKQEALLAAVLREEGMVLQYCEVTGRLISWNWCVTYLASNTKIISPQHSLHRPVNQLKARISPEDMDDFRAAYDFMLPACFCSIEEVVESAIHFSYSGVNSGNWTARCASGACLYAGQYIHVRPCGILD